MFPVTLLEDLLMSHSTRRLAPIASLFLLLSLAAFPAIAKKGMDSEKAPLRYVDAKSLDFKQAIPSPPGLDTAEFRNEIEFVLKVQNERTDAEVVRAKSEGMLTFAAFKGILGPWFIEENLPVTAKLIKDATSDSKFFTGAAKAHYARPRPGHDPRIKPIFAGDDEFSYPSGHATRGILIASILSELEPSQKKALMDRGREIGWDRVIAGAHYLSDVVAGRMMGQALFREMASNNKFKADLEAAQAEFAEVKKKQEEK
jgi:acid phosphatase (class A)